MAEDNELTFYINGEKVDEISDTTSLQGGFGVFIHGSAGESAVWLDQIRYWEIP